MALYSFVDVVPATVEGRLLNIVGPLGYREWTYALEAEMGAAQDVPCLHYADDDGEWVEFRGIDEEVHA